MHSYGKDFKYPHWVHIGLAIVALGIYFLIDAANLYLINKAFLHSEWIRPATALTIFGFLELVFDRWLWRLLASIPGLDVYNLAGVYRGHVSGKDQANPEVLKTYPATIVIKQTWSKIEIQFASGSAPSASFCASIVQDRKATGQIELIYSYKAEGSNNGIERVGSHYGTTMLLVEGDDLTGEYYTEQSRDSYGTLSLKRAPSK